MESVNVEIDEIPTIKTCDEGDAVSQPSTPAPPPWNDGSPQAFSHRFSRTRKVTARRNVTPAPDYILDMMRTDPQVEYNTIDLTGDDDTSLKLQAVPLANNYNSLPTNGLPVSDSYHDVNAADSFRKLASTPGIDSYDGLGITIDRTEYVPRNLPPSVLHQNSDLIESGGMVLKAGADWMNSVLDPTSLSQNEMLAMMLQTSQPIPRPWGQSSNVETHKNLTYPGVDLTKYGPLPQLQPIPPVFSEKSHHESKPPPPYPYAVPPSDLIPAKDIKRELIERTEISDLLSLESMQMRWAERMSSSASSECSISTGNRNEEIVSKGTSQLEQPSKRRRTALQAPSVEPHLWTRKGLRPCAARLARSAEETMHLNSPLGDKDDINSVWKLESVTSRPPSPQYSDISDAPSIPVSGQNSRHSRSSSLSPHGSSTATADGITDSSASPKKSNLASLTINLKRCAVRVPRCSNKPSVSLTSPVVSSAVETSAQPGVEASNKTSSRTSTNNVENLDDNAPFKCSLCLLRFWKEDLFRDHACLGRPWHQCSFCLSRFLSVANLQRHVASKHPNKSNKMGKMKQLVKNSSANVSNKQAAVGMKLPASDILRQAPEGMSEGDIHKWLFSVWNYKDKPMSLDGIKCLLCEKVCFQVLSMKAHVLGVHKINLFNRQYQTPQSSPFEKNAVCNEMEDTRPGVLEPLAKRKNKGAEILNSSFSLKSTSPKNVPKAKSGAELKLKIATLLRQEIEKSKERMAKSQSLPLEEQVKGNEHNINKGAIVPSKVVEQVPNGVVKKTIGLMEKGKQKVRFQYVKSLCQTMWEKNVTVVQLKNWLFEINTHPSESYECILCKKVFNTLKSMQCHCLSVHRIPPQLKSFKPIWKGMKVLKAEIRQQTENSAIEFIGENRSDTGSLDAKINVSADLKRDLTKCLSKNLRNLLAKAHLVGNEDCEDDVESDVRDVIQYSIHSVSEEAMAASLKQFHPPVIVGIVKPTENDAVASKLDKDPPSPEEIDRWLDSLKTAACGEEDTDLQLECLMCSEIYHDVESMASHVSLVHRLTGLPVPSSLSQSNKDVIDVDTQASEAADPTSVPPLHVMELHDLRLYTKILMIRLYSEETLSAFGFPECSTEQLLMRILEHSGFSYCWFAEETEDLLHNALCRNLKTLLAVSLPPEIKAHIQLNTNPMPVVLKDLLDYTAEKQVVDRVA